VIWSDARRGLDVNRALQPGTTFGIRILERAD
jgi:hypothetical protein